MICKGFWKVVYLCRIGNGLNGHVHHGIEFSFLVQLRSILRKRKVNCLNVRGLQSANYHLQITDSQH